MLLRIILKDISREILTAENGIIAVEICRNNTDIDLIMMDTKMPLMGGHEATRKIRRFNKHSIIIAQTAHAFESDRKKAIAVGCDGFLSKPVIRDELMSLIQKYFDK